MDRMKIRQFLKVAVAGLASVGFLLPQTGAQAGKLIPTPRSVAAIPGILDVEMSATGTVTGQMIDSKGKPVDGAVVVFRQGKRDVTKAVTDSKGVFVARDLRGGVYRVISQQGQSVYRLWTPKTAPPIAKSRMVLTQRRSLVRGQDAFVPPAPISLFQIGLVGVSGLSLGLAIDSQNQVDDLEKIVDDLQMSP
jgi:hypothetical protein